MKTIIVPGKPQGKGRPRFTWRGRIRRAYTPKATREYEERIRSCWRGAEKLIGPVHLGLEAVFPIPKSFTKEQRRLIKAHQLQPIVKPDLDNIVKVVMDALTGLAWDDDKQVTTVEASKTYGNYLDEEPGLKIEIDVT